MNETELYKAAIAMWGKQTQSDMMIEEMAELTKSILDYRRGRTGIIPIIEELVDVQIMINQMKIMFCHDDEYNKWMEFKLKRLESLVI